MLIYPFRTVGKTVATTLLVGPEGQPVDGPTTATPGAPERRGWDYSIRQACSLHQGKDLSSNPALVQDQAMPILPTKEKLTHYK